MPIRYSAFGVRRSMFASKTCASRLTAKPKLPSALNLLRRLNLPNHGVEVRPFAGLELGMKELAIGLNFERAAT